MTHIEVIFKPQKEMMKEGQFFINEFHCNCVAQTQYIVLGLFETTTNYETDW